MKQQTLQAYLFASGVLESGDSEAIAAAKKAYRKAYLKQKKAAFRAAHTTVSVSFPNSEAAALQKKAAQYNRKLAPFIKACTRAYVQQQFLLPNEDEVQQLELLLRNIGNNVNQIARHCHRLDIPPVQAIQSVQNILKQWESHISMSLRQPESLDALLYNALQKEPEYAHRVRELLHLAAQEKQNPQEQCS